MSQYVVAVSGGYKILQALHFPDLNDDCLSAFMAHKGRTSSYGVFLRDGATGKRYTIAEACHGWTTKSRCMRVQKIGDDGPNPDKFGVYILMKHKGWCWGHGANGLLEFDTEEEAYVWLKENRPHAAQSEDAP